MVTESKEVVRERMRRYRERKRGMVSLPVVGEVNVPMEDDRWGMVAGLVDRVTALESQVAALESRLASIELTEDDPIGRVQRRSPASGKVAYKKELDRTLQVV